MKQRVAYADLAWAAAFARIEEGQKLSAEGITYTVDWKHQDPAWLRLKPLRNQTVKKHRMVRQGDPLLLELRPE